MTNGSHVRVDFFPCTKWDELWVWTEAIHRKIRNCDSCYYTWFLSDERWCHLQSQNNWCRCVHQNLPHINVQDYTFFLNHFSCLSCCALPFVDHHFSSKSHHFLHIYSNVVSKVISSWFSFFNVFSLIYDSSFKHNILISPSLCPLSEGLNSYLLGDSFTMKNCCLHRKMASSPKSVIGLSGTKKKGRSKPKECVESWFSLAKFKNI